MTIFCLSCPAELPVAHESAVSHFIERKVKAQFVNAIHAETFGVLACRPYRKDHPTAGYLNPVSQVGLALSHYMVWNICMFHSDDVFLILEDDCQFEENWRDRLDKAIDDAPEDWDCILAGNSNTFDKPTVHIKGDIYECKYPFTTHCYLIRRKALPVLIEHCRDAAMKIDIALIEYAYPKLNTFTILPRLAEQRGSELAK